ncbi:MAG: primosomal protein N' [Pseudomonadota bacterium]
MTIIRVLIPHLQLPILDYLLLENTGTKVGDLVLVPFRNKQIVGIVFEIDILSDIKKPREVIEVYDTHIDPKMLTFLSKASRYYLAELGSLAKLMLPLEMNLALPCPRSEEFVGKTLPPLSLPQNEALEKISACEGVSVLKGVTGSGKTEVYFHLIAELLQKGQQSLLMLPEIALSRQIIDRFKERFGFDPDIWNSSISPAKKRKLLGRILEGDAKIVIGTRSALFLPYKNLRLIVVDEEHDQSYKQEDGVLYNARDMAVMRGAIMGHSIVLGSATPSIETLYNVSIGKYNLVTLGSRFGEAVLPEVKIIDMRLHKMPKESWISPPLQLAIRQALELGEQSMIFLNRRGYAPMLLCSSCGHRVSCKSCSSWLVLHKSKKRLECHHCGYVTSIKSSCPECAMEDVMLPCGPGVERIAEEIAHKFPEAKIQLMTKEELKTDSEIQIILKRIHEREIDILIGTQVITKGYHFPHLSLVGVVDADIGLGGGDLRGSERAFQLLHQVSGRAGRAQTKGAVYLQTYNPGSGLLDMLTRNEFDDFISYELSTRVENNMPPIAKMAAILLSGKNEVELMMEGKKFVSFAPMHELIRVLGPAAATLSKLKNKYRCRILVITDRKIDIQAYLRQWLGAYKIPSKIHVKVDIDPYSFS